MRNKTWFVIGPVLLFLTGCPPSPYEYRAQVDGNNVFSENLNILGYSEKKLTDRLYVVSYTSLGDINRKKTSANRNNLINANLKYALLRAAEIAQSNGYSSYTVERVEDHSTVDEYDHNFRYKNKFVIHVRFKKSGEKMDEGDMTVDEVKYFSDPSIVSKIKYVYSPFYEKDFLKNCTSGEVKLLGDQNCRCKIRNMGELIPDVSAEMYVYPGQSSDSEKSATITELMERLNQYCKSDEKRLITYRKKLPYWLAFPGEAKEQADKSEAFMQKRDVNE